MKLTFLGTGAADWPQKRGDGEHRYLSSLLVNDDLLIDPGPCIFDAAADFGVSFDKVRDVLVTHSHSDHFNKSTVSRVACGGTTVYGDVGIAGKIPGGTSFAPLKLFEDKNIGRYTITPLPANHRVEDTSEQPLHYIISDGEKAFFYGLDGAWIYNSASHILRARSFDLLVFDCTSGDVEGEYRIFEHNTIKMVEYMLKSIKMSFPETLRPGCRVMVSHMARTLHTSHDELVKRLEPSGIIPAHDGMTVEL